MTTPIEAIESIQAISPVQSVGMPATERVGATVTAGTATTRADAHAQLNVSILQASVDVSISSGNESLALLLQSAIAGINDILEPEFGKNAIQNAASQDNTPEGTAGRIVSLSTGFYAAFKQQHAGEAEADVLKDFMATIRRGFEQGYQEARDILQGMNVLSGDIAGNIDKTYALVLQGYAEFAVANGGDQSGAAEMPPGI
jgi:hypothetical protein